MGPMSTLPQGKAVIGRMWETTALIPSTSGCMGSQGTLLWGGEGWNVVWGTGPLELPEGLGRFLGPATRQGLSGSYALRHPGAPECTEELRMELGPMELDLVQGWRGKKGASSWSFEERLWIGDGGLGLAWLWWLLWLGEQGGLLQEIRYRLCSLRPSLWLTMANPNKKRQSMVLRYLSA